MIRPTFQPNASDRHSVVVTATLRGGDVGWLVVCADLSGRVVKIHRFGDEIAALRFVGELVCPTACDEEAAP